MNSDFSRGPHSRALWQKVAPIVRQVEALPFLHALADGSLEALHFAHYLYQDGLYLTRYARAQAFLIASARQRDESLFWAESAALSIVAEENMQAEVQADPALAAARRELMRRDALKISPTTLGYSSFLIATAATAEHAEGVAAVLPCFWVYAHVGKWLASEAGLLRAGHPYRAWVELYDSPLFDTATRKAVGWLEHHLAASSAPLRARMEAVFEQACRYELHFWHHAHGLQNWQLEQTSPCPA